MPRFVPRALLPLVLVPVFSFAAPAQMQTPAQFSVGANGAATFTIPIQVAPGVAGVQPDLSLTYSSSAGTGLMGVGWSINGFSTITRCGTSVAQDGQLSGVNAEAADQFCMNGQRLILVSGAPGGEGSEYRTEIDGISKIVSYGPSYLGPTRFKVWTKSGQKLAFGDAAATVISADRQRYISWSLYQVYDVKGNYYQINYSDSAVSAQRYPVSVEYTRNDDFDYSLKTAGLRLKLNNVRFGYENLASTEITSTYQMGHKTANPVRLTSVRSYLYLDDGQSVEPLIREYRIAYDKSPTTQRSRVTSITECDKSINCMPSMTFGWQGSVPNFAGDGSGYWAGPVAGQSSVTGDFNGDGKADILAYSGSGNVWNLCLSNGTAFNCSDVNLVSGADVKNLVGDFNGDGKSDIMVYSGSANQWNLCLANDTGFNCSVVQAGSDASIARDFNGDGRTDMISYLATNQWQLCLSNGAGFDCSTVAATTGDSVFGDFNGDGRTDMMAYLGSGQWSMCLSTGNAFTCGTVAAHSGGTQNNVIGDFNGDGLTDLMSYNGANSQWQMCLATGKGFDCSTVVAHAAGVQGNVAGDFNGDGRTDLTAFNAATGQWRLCMASGSGFACSDVAGPATAENKDLSADYNGDGKTDLMRFSSADGRWHAMLANNAAVDLMTSISRGLGGTTNISYKPLTDVSVYTKLDSPASASIYPLRDLQIPLYVVAAVSSPNGIGGTLTTTYKYGGLKENVSARTQMGVGAAFLGWAANYSGQYNPGFSSGMGRNLLGFAWVESQQIESKRKSRTVYRQDWPYVGLAASTTTWLVKSAGDVQLSKNENTYDFLISKTLSGCVTGACKSYLPYLSVSLSNTWDLNGAVLPWNKVTIQPDQWGNPLQTTSSTEGGYSKTTVRTYLNDEANWYIGRPLSTVETSVSP
ncbi:FG-GAP-like repeat-containing protein [Duganella radicis]|uniref:Insecticide toxin TcdB middle/N-terminal domain-containing protein n=1 Tax=Duganella radicis TaxID=551988 RepID=A0A6L6PN38_9BURK|nr:FG-GAP-like repeat-containing protein [Duganella radicis]MTV40550.1 hypothetical protein [Duganella radicis]